MMSFVGTSKIHNHHVWYPGVENYKGGFKDIYTTNVSASSHSGSSQEMVSHCFPLFYDIYIYSNLIKHEEFSTTLDIKRMKTSVLKRENVIPPDTRGHY